MVPWPGTAADWLPRTFIATRAQTGDDPAAAAAWRQAICQALTLYDGIAEADDLSGYVFDVTLEVHVAAAAGAAEVTLDQVVDQVVAALCDRPDGIMPNRASIWRLVAEKRAVAATDEEGLWLTILRY
ncbi:MAG: hypothetical protein RIE31_07110 [Alphaproteobacteria bacterium]